ncbi:hypothetical protein E9529_10585 [Blastococcus sp. KM273128]|nr:hypothetical protein [Blastococcus sp. KM273128]
MDPEAGDRGGRPGRWSARKSQLLVSEYEGQGGGYRHEGERTGAQRHLEEWTGQDWHTADGDADARTGDGTTRRYLPDAAWQLLTPAERRATDREKQQGREQHVANTDAAREARAAAELIGMKAPEARRRVAELHGESQLDRAERAERELGTGRKTVLERIERQRSADG